MARRAGVRSKGRRRLRIDSLVLLVAILGAVPALGGKPLLGAPAPDDVSGATPGPSSLGSAPAGGPSAGAPGSSGAVQPSSGGGPMTVRVNSIEALLGMLRNNLVDEVVVADGVYHVSPSNEERSDSLWIGGGAIAARTRPITVRAETIGGVVFDGSGGSGYGGLSFEDGAHDQTWDGFVFANMAAEQSGIIEVGGYVARRTPHHLTLRNITIRGTCTGTATSADAPAVDHAVYISNAERVGPHDLLFEDFTVDGRGGLASAFHFDHGSPDQPNATGVTVRRLHVTGSQQAIILWQPPLHDITFDQVDIVGALSHAIRFESVGATNIVFSQITSTGTGGKPFASSLGSTPPGVTFIADSLH